MTAVRQTGRFIEDFAVGDRLEHAGGRTVTEADVVWFSLLTMNAHPLHVHAHDPDYGEGRRLAAPATLVLSVVLGLSVRDVSWNATANLSWDAVRFGAPVFAGDSLCATTEVTGVDDDAHLLSLHTVGRNQDGDEVVRVDRVVRLRPRRIDDPA